jgi:trimethylamine--corrinoid protein Co-methyltransferase
MMTLLTSLQSKHNFILHCAGILDSFAAMSYEQYIVDLEIMRRAYRYLQPVEIDEAALSFEVIKEIGPGGEFLTSDDTLEKVRTHAWTSEIDIKDLLPGKTLNDQFLEHLHTKLQLMLESYRKPELDADIQKSLEEYLINAGIDQKIIDTINAGNEGDQNDLW